MIEFRDLVQARALATVIATEPGALPIMKPQLRAFQRLIINKKHAMLAGRSHAPEGWEHGFVVASRGRYCFLLTASWLGWVDLDNDQLVDWEDDEVLREQNDYAVSRCPGLLLR